MQHPGGPCASGGRDSAHVRGLRDWREDQGDPGGDIRQHFPGIKKGYERNECWSAGVFASTIGIEEAVTKRYVEFQGRSIEAVKLKLAFGF